MVLCEVDISQEEVIRDLEELFPEYGSDRKRSLSGADIVQILVPASAVVAALASSKVLVKYIESKRIKIKMNGIEYEGRAENLPEFLKEKMKE